MSPQFNKRSWSDFPLRDLVEEVAQSLASRCKDQAIEMTIDIPANLIVTADRTLIRRAVEHLMLGAHRGDARRRIAVGNFRRRTRRRGTRNRRHRADPVRRGATPCLRFHRRHRARRLGLGVGDGVATLPNCTAAASRPPIVPKGASRSPCEFHAEPPWRPPHNGCSPSGILTTARSVPVDDARLAADGGLLAAAVVAALGYLGTQQVARPDTDLMHGVPIANSQLPLMEAAFDKAKLKGYVIRGSSILVPRGEESKYMAALVAANALPPRMGAAGHEALNGGSLMEMGSARDQQRMRIAKQEALAQGIRLRPGIEDASVDYDVDQPAGSSRTKWRRPSSASSPGTNQLDEATVLAIRDMVVGAFAGLKPENVAVADSNGRTWRGPIGTAEEINTVWRNEPRTGSEDQNPQRSAHSQRDVQVNVELKREHRPRKAANRAATPAVARQEPARSAGRLAETERGRGARLSVERLERRSQRRQSRPARRRAVEKVASLTPISARVLVRVPIELFQERLATAKSRRAGQAEKTPDQAALDQIRIEESANIQRCVAPLLPPAKTGQVLRRWSP